MSVATKTQVRDCTKRHCIAALFFDLGDTLMVEESEIKDGEGMTLRADLIPGATAALRRFEDWGHTLALVADARPDTPVNVLWRHGQYDLFDYLAISEIIGVEKPDALIFRDTLDALGIPGR